MVTFAEGEVSGLSSPGNPIALPKTRESVDNEVMKVDVECYSGRKANERPVRFRLTAREYSVEAVLDQWYEPESIFYKVRADDGNLYILRQHTAMPGGMWELVSFREQKSAST